MNTRSIKMAVAALALAGSAGLASATPLTVDGGWQSFSFGLAGPIAIDQFTVDVAAGTHVKIRITDGFIIGDEFGYSIDGGAMQFTSDADAFDGTQSGAVDGDSAWADLRLSHAIFNLFEGSHTIDLFLTENAFDTTGGGAFIRADIPEPGSMALIALGLIGLGAARRRQA